MPVGATDGARPPGRTPFAKPYGPLRRYISKGNSTQVSQHLFFREESIMASDKGHRRKRTSIWLIFGVGILILLLLTWLTIADFWGDTDVAACIGLI